MNRRDLVKRILIAIILTALLFIILTIIFSVALWFIVSLWNIITSDTVHYIFTLSLQIFSISLLVVGCIIFFLLILSVVVIVIYSKYAESREDSDTI